MDWTGLDYLRRIWKYRYFWSALALNDIRNRYRRSFLGIGWSLIRPLGMTLVFWLVFGKIFNLEAGDYIPYLFLGLAAWQFLTEAMLGGCSTFQQGATYIKQVPMPLAIFPLRTVLSSGFHALIAFGLAVAFAACYKGLPHPLALLGVLPGVVVLFFLGWFLAILCGMVHVHFPDTRHLLEIGLQILFYLTPIMYLPQSIGARTRLVWVTEMNPFTWVLAILRAPVLNGTFPDGRYLALSVAFLTLIGLLAAFCLKKLERTLVFWV
jgi:lipopolysaccharide transport system permease protein